MPTTDRYVLNELQQATLDVMAANVMPGDDEDLSRSAMTREDIIAGVQAVPGQDEVNGNHMGPTMACLKRRGLVSEVTWPRKGRFHITPMGITYVDLDGEPEPEVPRGELAMKEVDKAVEEIEAEQQAPKALSRDELLTRLAMEVPPSTWAPTAESRIFEGERFYWNEYQLRREELIYKPSWGDAPKWAQFIVQQEMGLWCWYRQKPELESHKWRGGISNNKMLQWRLGAIPAGHDWRETLEARPASLAPSPGASSTACDDQHRPEPAEPDAELETDLLATRDAIVGIEKALEEMDEARLPVCVCGNELDAGEAYYYGSQCEACVWADHKAMQSDMEETAAHDASPEPAPAGAPEVTILQVAVHPPGTAWLDHDATVLIKLMDEGSGPYLDISSWDGPAAIESLEMLEAVTNTARNLLREAEAREVGA